METDEAQAALVARNSLQGQTSVSTQRLWTLWM